MFAKICSILAQTDFGVAENFGVAEHFGGAENFQRRRNFGAVPKKLGPFFDIFVRSVYPQSFRIVSPKDAGARLFACPHLSAVPVPT